MEQHRTACCLFPNFSLGRWPFVDRFPFRWVHLLFQQWVEPWRRDSVTLPTFALLFCYIILCHRTSVFGHACEQVRPSWFPFDSMCFHKWRSTCFPTCSPALRYLKQCRLQLWNMLRNVEHYWTVMGHESWGFASMHIFVDEFQCYACAQELGGVERLFGHIHLARLRKSVEYPAAFPPCHHSGLDIKSSKVWCFNFYHIKSLSHYSGPNRNQNLLRAMQASLHSAHQKLKSGTLTCRKST